MRISLVGSVSGFFVLGYVSIFASSIASAHEILFGGFEIWMLVAILFALRFCYVLSRGTVQRGRMNVAWAIFLLLVAMNGFVSIFTGGSFLRSSLLLVTLLSTYYLFFCHIPSKANLNRVFLGLIVIMSGIALLQSVSFFLGLPVIGSSYYTARGEPGFQATSIFHEPAHFAGFLIAATYFIAFANIEKKLALLLLIVFTSLATKSVGAIIGVGVVVILATVTSRSKSLLLSLLPIIAGSLFFADNILYVMQRLSIEIIPFLSQLSQPFVLHQEGGMGSGALRTINEFNYLLGMPTPALVFGNGIGYDTFEHGRLMALNGFVEMIARLGFFGVTVFVVALYLEKRSYPSRSLTSFWITLCLLFFVDGAIAKLAFWLPIGILLLTDRVLAEN